ncbi:MAG TPA: hypothetical protein PLI09_19575 [Candidatus Hydrogenedentes bacterium]|nr:hypothetical protein [Candidatus Hydrogenedentota bacterium]
MNRGGSWNNTPRNCRAAYRNNNSPDNRNNNLGFRVLAVRRFGRRTSRRTGHSPTPSFDEGVNPSKRGKVSRGSGCFFRMPCRAIKLTRRTVNGCLIIYCAN